MNRQIYYWLQGGMRHRTADDTHAFHVQSDRYRADFDIHRGRLTALDLCPVPLTADSCSLASDPAPLDLDVSLEIDTSSGRYCASNTPKETTQAYVMDNGPCVHRTKVEALRFEAADGTENEHIDGHAEILFWHERICFIYDLSIDGGTELTNVALRLTTAGRWHVELDADEKLRWGALAQTASAHVGLLISDPSRLNSCALTADGHTLRISFGTNTLLGVHLLAIQGDQRAGMDRAHALEQARRSSAVSFAAAPICGTPFSYCGYDGLRGFFLFTMANDDTKKRYKEFPDEIERYGYRLTGADGLDSTDEVAILLNRTGVPGNGELDMEGIWRPWGSFAVHRDANGMPSGQNLQISKDFHEFNEYVKSYSHCWLNIYAIQTVAELKQQNEIAVIYHAFYGKPAAQFAQLSLLGWDDNRQFKPKSTAILGQLWHQGIVGEAEVFCISPESIHTDNFYTDWRALRAGSTLPRWGDNFGGGDLLRYRRDGWDHRIRLVVPRAEYLSYGPMVGRMRYNLISEDETFRCRADHAILSANDIVRVFIDLQYMVVSDAVIEDISLFAFGAENYNPSRMDELAAGTYGEVSLRSILKDGVGESLLPPAAVGAGDWFAQAGYANAKGKEEISDRAGRAIIFKQVDFSLRNHPGTGLEPVLVEHPRSFKIPGRTWRIEFKPDPAGQIRVASGDRIRLSIEICTFARAAEYYDGDCPYFNALMASCVDEEIISTLPACEAFHGDLEWVVFRGARMDSLLPEFSADENGVVEFEMTGGLGLVPITLVTPDFRGRISLEADRGAGWGQVPLEAASGGMYQVDRVPGEDLYRVIVGIDCQPESLDRKLKARYRITAR